MIGEKSSFTSFLGTLFNICLFSNLLVFGSSQVFFHHDHAKKANSLQDNQEHESMSSSFCGFILQENSSR